MLISSIKLCCIVSMDSIRDELVRICFQIKVLEMETHLAHVSLCKKTPRLTM